MKLKTEQEKLLAFHESMVRPLAIVVLIVTILNFAGWFFHLPTLTFAINGYPAMRFNTSLCLFLTATTFFINNKTIKNILGFLVLGFGLATLSQYFLKINLGIDELFVKDFMKDGLGYNYPGRMALITAVVNTLTALAILLKNNSKRSGYAWQTLSFLNMFLMSVAIVDYLYIGHSLDAFYFFSQLSMATTFLFILINLSLCFSGQHEGYMATFISQHSGGRLSRRLLPLSISTLWLLGYLASWIDVIYPSLKTDCILVVSFGSSMLAWLIWRNGKSLNEKDAGLLRSNYELQLLINHSPNAVAMFDNEMKYIWVSKQWQKDYSLASGDYIGKCIYDTDPITLPWRDYHMRALAGIEQKSEEDLFVREDGQKVWLNWSMQPWHTPEGKIGGIIIFTKNITQQKIAEDNLKQLNAELEQKVLERTQEAKNAVVARERILSIVSHDLKNPMTAMDIAAQFLLRQELPYEKVKEIAQRVRRSSKVMQRLISDLQDFGKINSGMLTVEKTATDARATIAAALEFVLPKANQKNIHITLNVEHEVPLILGDKHRLVQVLWNLLGNAVKFAPEFTEIKVTCKVEEQFLKFSVADYGPGIASDEIPNLFQLFWQGSKTSGGVGLGLSIAKGIVDAHGGRIWCESEVGKGTTFNFTIPLAHPETAGIENNISSSKFMA